MLIRAVKGTEWSQFLDYVSPSFFEVVPLTGLLAQGREIAANAAGRSVGAVRDEVRGHIEKRAVAVQLLAPDELPPGAECGVAEGELDEEAARALGQRALEVYFAQIFASDVSIVDLRSSRWASGDGTAAFWAPRPMWVRWESDFLAGMRDLYRGFYRDDDAAFARGVAQLDLGEAGDVLRKHFGAGDQRAVRFHTEVFQSTFHEAFLRCRDAGVKLHRNFLVLGLYLACLYDLLETLGLEFDVRAAYELGAGEA